MASKIAQKKDEMRTLSAKALTLVENPDVPLGEKKLELDKIETDIKSCSDVIAELEYIAEKRAKFATAGEAAPEEVVTPVGPANGSQPARVKTLGDQFIESAGYKTLMKHGLKGGSWSTGDIDIKTLYDEASVKTLLAEGTVAAPGNGNAPVATPTVLPGLVDIRFYPLTIVDLFPSGVTETPLIRYLVETVATNAAAAIAEGSLKPESALTFAKVDETLHKIATFFSVTDEMLEDFTQIRSYIDARLMLFVKQQEEAQILSGDGTGSNVVGLLNRSGLATPIVKGTAPSIAGDNDMDAIYRQITAIRVTSFIEPDNIVIDAQGWQNILLAKTAQGLYYANGPFANTEPPQLWSKPVTVSLNPLFPALTAIVGGFALGGQVWRKGGLVVEASNSHNDYFQRNQTAIRAEERVGLAIYRPGAFGKVTNL